MRKPTVMRPDLELRRFQEELEAERERLLNVERELAESSRQAKDSLESFSDADDVPADIAAQASEREKDQLYGQNVQQTLAQIQLALDRLDDGTFGICEMCGCEVPEARLERMPWVATCVECQRMLETG
ncbi:MAG: TraR/DksA C4-type zinc finger protein [Fimbriimonadaceae bacterium]|nr:TraR/DksA C4-type zinc finger protein [Fimbriimonadaceae bacterium]